MPYKHAGELGDIWKHLPLCELLICENPKRYFETNSAYAKYLLPNNPLKQYGVFYYLSHTTNHMTKQQYYEILKAIDTEQSRNYFGSPALAMTLLSEQAEYFFHDIEEAPLEDIRSFASSMELQNKVKTVKGDSITSFLDGRYSFTANDFVFIDPYMPFDCNKSGQNFFDVFLKAYREGAKTVLWYGYDNLKSKIAIMETLQSISRSHNSKHIYTFDIRQSCMEEQTCTINPGVPGCGLALANLSEDSTQNVNSLLQEIAIIYQKVPFDGIPTSIITDSLVL